MQNINGNVSGRHMWFRSPENLIPFLLLLLLLLPACSDDNDKPLPEPEYLFRSEEITRFTISDINDRLETAGDLSPVLALLVQHDVTVHRIIYKTTGLDGNQILASGALVVPENKNPMPLMSFHHGTLDSDDDAPSWFTSDSYFLAVLYASTGYILAIPDYLGYGYSNEMDHPYQHRNSLATASRDMLRAVREFDTQNGNFSASNKLFLTGYSEGGYATVSLLKLLEEEHNPEFSVTASTAGAGAYNKTEFAKYIIAYDSELTYMNYFLWVLDTYNNIYGINRPSAHYFNEPYATVIETGGVFANYENNPQKLFTDQFRNSILDGTDQEFLSVLADNDVFDWKPLSPLQLYHGTEDDFVFYFNSLTAWESMRARGAQQVELVPVEGGNHITAISEYFFGTFLFFSRYLN